MKLSLSRSFIVILSSSFFLSGCLEHFDPSHVHFKEKIPSRSDKEIRAPKILVKKIEKIFLDNYHLENPEDETSDAKLLVSIPRKYLGFNVYLRAIKNKLAFSEPVKINFPRGGGYVDFADIVEGKRGSFYLNMSFDWKDMGLEDTDVSNLKIFFIGNTARRQINEQEWGSGCNKLFDVAQLFKTKIMGKGLLLNSTDQRYLSTVGGTFYFVLAKRGELHLATATFEDSRYPKLSCRG